MAKKLFFLLLLSVAASIGKAQCIVAVDSSYIFSFPSGRNMFYVPYKGNEDALARLLNLIDGCREDILSGKITVSVNGYCTDVGIAKTQAIDCGGGGDVSCGTIHIGAFFEDKDAILTNIKKHLKSGGNGAKLVGRGVSPGGNYKNTCGMVHIDCCSGDYPDGIDEHAMK